MKKQVKVEKKLTLNDNHVNKSVSHKIIIMNDFKKRITNLRKQVYS